VLIINYGTDTLGNREIAKSGLDISVYVSKLVSLRLLTAILLYFIFALFLLLAPISSILKNLFFIYAITFLANAILINWAFRGLEKAFPISMAQLTSSLFSLLALILLVHHPDSEIYVISIFTISSFINAFILLLYFLKSSYHLKFLIDPVFNKEVIIASTPLAISALMINLYYSLDQVMLGIISTQKELGYYAAAYKIILIAIIPGSLILQSFFPQIAKYNNEITQRSRIMNIYARIMLVTGTFITFIGLLFAGEIIRIIFGQTYQSSIPLLRILILNVFFVYINMMFGNPLIAWNKQKQYSYAITAGAIVNVILNFILIPKYFAYGAAVATILSEVAVLFGVSYSHRKFTNDAYIEIILKTAGIFIVIIFFGRIFQLFGVAWWLVLVLTVIGFLLMINKYNLLSLAIIKEFINEKI
jgi:O-antigen/teichoic acid export membrane protein